MQKTHMQLELEIMACGGQAAWLPAPAGQYSLMLCHPTSSCKWMKPACFNACSQHRHDMALKSFCSQHIQWSFMFPTHMMRIPAELVQQVTWGDTISNIHRGYLADLDLQQDHGVIFDICRCLQQHFLQHGAFS